MDEWTNATLHSLNEWFYRWSLVGMMRTLRYRIFHFVAADVAAAPESAIAVYCIGKDEMTGAMWWCTSWLWIISLRCLMVVSGLMVGDRHQFSSSMHRVSVRRRCWPHQHIYYALASRAMPWIYNTCTVRWMTQCALTSGIINTSDSVLSLIVAMEGESQTEN